MSSLKWFTETEDTPVQCVTAKRGGGVWTATVSVDLPTGRLVVEDVGDDKQQAMGKALAEASREILLLPLPPDRSSRNRRKRA